MAEKPDKYWLVNKATGHVSQFEMMTHPEAKKANERLLRITGDDHFEWTTEPDALLNPPPDSPVWVPQTPGDWTTQP